MSEQATTPVEATIPAAAPPVEYKELNELTEKQDAHWRMTGELPEKGSKEAPKPQEAEKEPAKEAESPTEPGTEDKPESKPSNTGLTSMGHKELRARVKELEAELAAKSTAPKTDAKPAVEPPTPKTEKLRAKPTQQDTNKDGTPKYKDWEEYNEDLIDWKADQKFTEYRKNEEKARQEATVAEQNRTIQKTWSERVDKASEKYADFAEVALDEKGPGALINPGSVIDAWILDSELGPEILYHFGKDRSDLKRIGAMHPIAAARELTKLESKLSGEPAKTPPTEPPLKTTKAPPPTREVGGRGSTPPDDVARALENDDTGAYMEAANRRDIASRLKR